MKPKPSHKEKTLQAFRVYVEVMETAAWLRGWMRGPLETFDLTQQGFRLLLLLYEEGRPVLMREAARRMRFKRQTLDPVVRRLERRGWVKRGKVNLPQAAPRPRSKTRLVGPRRRKWGIGVIELTPEGDSFLANVFPRHAKVLRALMRALLGREQKVLVEICRKLREGAILKFMSEIALVEEWESDDAREVETGDDETEEARSKLLWAKSGGASTSVRLNEGNGRHEAGADRKKIRELLGGILTKMNRHDILNAAKHVDWHLLPDEEREAGHAVSMLMNLGNDEERELLERMTRKMADLEIVRALRGMAGASVGSEEQKRD